MLIRLNAIHALMLCAGVCLGQASTLTADATATPQSAVVGTAFGSPLSATLLVSGNPSVGTNITFTAPTTGASGTFANGSTTFTIATNASGVASAAFTANSTFGGPYTVTASSGTLSVNFRLTNTNLSSNPVITLNPSNLAVFPGATASFSAAATGASSLQWQVSTDGGGSFTNIAGATATPLFFVATLAQNSYQYRCVFFTNSGNSVTTAATLTVSATTAAPVVTQNPTDVTVGPGATVTFSAAASGNPAPTIQWQASAGGGPFVDIPGAAANPLAFTSTPAQNGNQYRAVFTNVNSTATTAAATLTVTGGPAIRGLSPVIPSFLGNAGFSSNMYVEIYGSNFTTVTRTWAGGDFAGSQAPTSLEGVGVTIDGKNAFVYFVSPGQINVNVPDDSTAGQVSVQVTTAQAHSNTVTATLTLLSPTLQTIPQFNIGGRQYVVALTPDFGAFVGAPNLIAGFSFVPKRPGDVISIYALGAGPTNPPTPAGTIAAVNSPISSPFQLKIGGVQAATPFAGIVAGTVGLYQFNVVIPQVGAGDHTIELIVDGVPNNQNLYLNVGP